MRSTAATAASTLSTMYPVVPSTTTSGTEPRGNAMTGVPAAMDSIITSPKGSAHWIGKSVAKAPA
jgi:hypothetical protein